MRYLRNITAKMSVVLQRVDTLTERVEALGQACGTAFHQTKTVVNKLADTTEETRMDLCEHMGTIDASSFVRGC
jgi:hypothetical protein